MMRLTSLGAFARCTRVLTIGSRLPVRGLIQSRFLCTSAPDSTTAPATPVTPISTASTSTPTTNPPVASSATGSPAAAAPPPAPASASASAPASSSAPASTTPTATPTPTADQSATSSPESTASEPAPYQKFIDQIKVAKTTDQTIDGLEAAKKAGVAGVEVYTAVMKNLLDDNYMRKAEWLYKEMKTNNIPISEDIYHSMMKGFGRVYPAAPDSAVNYVELMQRDAPIRNIQTFEILFKILGRENKVRLLDKALRLMGNDGLRPNVHIYNYIIEASFNRENTEKGMLTFRRMEKENVKPDQRTWNVIVTGYANYKNMKVEKAEEALENMVKAGFKPDSITYSGLAVCYARKGAPDKLLGILDRAKSEGIDIAPICQSNLTQFVRMLGEAKHKMDVQENMYFELQKRGAKPDMFVYGVLVNGFGRENNMVKAFDYLDQMRAGGHTPDREMIAFLRGRSHGLGLMDDFKKHTKGLSLK